LRLHGGESPTQHEARDIIERQTAHLARMIDDLLEVSRIATGRVYLRFTEVELNGVVKRDSGGEAAD